MKSFVKISSVLVVLLLIFSCLSITTNAEGNTTLFFSKNTAQVGDKVTVTASVNLTQNSDELSFYLQYDPKVLEYSSGDGTKGSDGVINVFKTLSNNKSGRFNFIFTAIGAGNSAISVVDCIYKTQENGAVTQKKFTGASATMTINGASASSDNALKSLSLSGCTLSPAFSSSKTSYKASVPYETKEINVTATPADSKAKVTVSGNKNLTVGDNTVTVSVEAANGTVKKYNIAVNRAKEETQDTSSDKVTTESSHLETVVDGKNFTIITKIPETALFNGFKIEETQVNGYNIETACDDAGNYRIFYLSSVSSDNLLPYLYNTDLDTFEPLKHITIGNNTYIFADLPDDLTYPETLYPSNTTIGDYSVECLTDSSNEFNYFKYVYCYFDGKYSLYRLDTDQLTLQRYPDFAADQAKSDSKKDNIFTRFGSLSTNGKIIMIALSVVILGVLSLLILLVVYLIRRTLNKNGEIILYSDDEDAFDEIEVKNDSTTV